MAFLKDSLQPNRPLLSVIVPTRNRADLARVCLNRLLEEASENVEIVVLENSDQPAIKPEEFRGAGYVRVFPSNGALDMPSNWERGLAIARGEYVAFISDKDMFLPGALSVLLEQLASRKHEIVCYRKAVFCSHRNILFHYRCKGQAHGEALAPMLQHLYGSFYHTHSAPMVYNSAVSCRLIHEIKGTKPQFFIGNSPDVITAVLFAAHRHNYLQLDEIVSVANSGDWSNGYSAERRGRRNERQADFVKLFKSNPFQALKLPVSIPSAIAEVLVTAQKAYPEKLSNLSINWQAYLEKVFWAINAMEITPAEKSEELTILKSSNCVVPRKEYYKFRLRHAMHRVKESLWTQPLQRAIRLKVRLFPGGGSACPNVGKSWVQDQGEETASGSTSIQAPLWSDAHYAYTTKVYSIEEALAVAAASNLHRSVV